MKLGAVPTINLPIKSHETEIPAERRNLNKVEVIALVQNKRKHMKIYLILKKVFQILNYMAGRSLISTTITILNLSPHLILFLIMK